jgi:hemolysin activation/secretion protein
MKKLCILCFLALSAPFWAIADSFVVEGAALADGNSFQSEVVADPLKGILIYGGSEKVRKESESAMCCVQVEDVALLSNNRSFLKKLSNEYVGKTLTQGALWKLKADIADFYCEKGQPFVIVTIPKQMLSNGILKIVVEEAVLGNVTVQGNKYYTPSQIKNYLTVEPGCPIDGRQLLKDMARMNQNPFRRTDAIYRPGKKPGTADLELATIDRWPYRFYMGADNTGTIATDRDRFFFGVNLGKTIVEDSEISYQFTCSPNWNLFNAQTALFRVPFPARQTFIAYGGYTQVQPKLSDGDSEKSQSWQVDGRYRIPIITNTSFLQEFILGFDYKQVIARIKRSGIQIFNNLASIDQFMIGYDLGHRSPHHKLALVLELYGAPGNMSHGNTTEKFEAFRPGAGPQYAYFKLSHSFAYRFKHFWVSYDINGQLSSKNLLPSEQFTLAGYNAVRGFEERVVNVDNAILLNLTLQTPRFSIGKLAGWSRRSFDELYFLAFFDCGYGGNTNPLIGESRTVSLGSIGPGVRYQIDRYVTARFDYGFQLWHSGFENPTHSRYNFGLIVSF